MKTNKENPTLSIIEEEEKLQNEHTIAQYSVSENEHQRNFSGLQNTIPSKLQPSSTHSLTLGPTLKKKPSLETSVSHKKPPLPLNIINDEDAVLDKLPDLKFRSQSEVKKLNQEDAPKNPKIPSSEKRERKSGETAVTHSDSLIKEKNVETNSTNFKSVKVQNEMKNFIKKKWSLSDFEKIIRNFFDYSRPTQSLEMKEMDEKMFVSIYSEVWFFFYRGIQITLYLNKEIKANVNKFKRNFMDSNKVRQSFNEFQKNLTLEEYTEKKTWKGYIDEIQKNIELYEENVGKINFLATFLENQIENNMDLTSKVNQIDLSERIVDEKVAETYNIFESELKTINSFAGMNTFSEDRLLMLVKIDKKESFVNFLEFFNFDVVKRHQNDLNNLIICLLLYFKKIANVFKEQADKERNFQKEINASCINLTKLTAILSKKVQNLALLKRSTCDSLSSMEIPFYENYEKNRSLLEEAHKNFNKILLKSKKIKKNLKLSRESFSNNFFLTIREKHVIYLLDQVEEVRDSTIQQLSLLPFFEEYPNYEIEIVKIQEICDQYQEDFQTNEDKEHIRDKVIFLAGKLHNLRVFSKEMEEKKCSQNPLLKILEIQLNTQLNSSYKLYDFLLKILNSTHSSELQKIKLLERELDKTFETLHYYYETLRLPEEFNIEQKIIELQSIKLEIENFTHLSDIPDVYKDICITKNSELEQELETLITFQDIRSNGREKIDYNRIRTIILNMKFDKYSNTLGEALNEMDKYKSAAKNISRMHPVVKGIVDKIYEIYGTLKVFSDVYENFYKKFMHVSEKYEELKRFVGGYRESFMNQVTSTFEKKINSKQDRLFFTQCAEFFYINLKNYFQSLIPENSDHIYNQTTHFLREIKGKIDNFYENRDNLKVMAVGYTRQLNIIKTIDQYLQILGKFQDQHSTKIRATKEHLLNLREIIEFILKPCHVAFLFEEFLDNLIKNKSLKLEVRLEKVKEMLKDLNDKLKIMENEEKKNIKDEKISSIYVYVKDDIKKVNLYILKLLPFIEEFSYFQKQIEFKKLDLDLTEENMEIYSKLVTFKNTIESMPEANRPLIFNDNNKINDFIQEYYFHWFGSIHNFLNSIDFNALVQIIQCYEFLNWKNVEFVLEETVKTYGKLDVFLTNNKKIKLLEAKSLRPDFSKIKTSLLQIEMSIFTLKHLEINIKMFSKLNRIDNINEFIKNLEDKFLFEKWKEVVVDSFHVIDKFCMGETSFDKALYNKERSKIKEKYQKIKLSQLHEKWIQNLLKVFE